MEKIAQMVMASNGELTKELKQIKQRVLDPRLANRKSSPPLTPPPPPPNTPDQPSTSSCDVIGLEEISFDEICKLVEECVENDTDQPPEKKPKYEG